MAWLALLVACLLCSSCSEERPPNLLLVTIDTLRADRLGAYGGEPGLTPNLDALARDGILFRNAVAPSPWTLPSVASLFTSLYPSVHGAVQSSNAMQSQTPGFQPTSMLDEGFETLAETLQRAGFRTGGFVRGAYPGAVFGFAQGFDRFQDNQTRALRFNVESLLEWLDEQEGGPFFAYLHIIEVHSPYVPPRIAPWERDQWLPEDLARATPIVAEEALRYLSFDPAPGYRGSVKGTLGNLKELEQSKGRIPEASRLRLLQIYDRGIAYTDYWMGQLFEALKQRDLWEQTIVVVTADHGEEFLEHGGLEHGRTQYDEVLRIPLIMHVPGVKGGWKIEQQVGLIDVLASQAAVVAAAVSGKHERLPHYRETLGPRAGAIDALLDLAVEALALGFADKWTQLDLDQ